MITENGQFIVCSPFISQTDDPKGETIYNNIPTCGGGEGGVIQSCVKTFPECLCRFVTYLLPLFSAGNFGTVSKTITKVESKHWHVDKLCVCVCVWGLRVRGEGSEQNLWHVLLAKGHQEQRQALIGWIHTAALKTAKTNKQKRRRGRANTFN